MKIDIKNRLQFAGLTYNEYFELTKSEVENTNIELLNDDEKDLFEYKKLNLQRSSRIQKHYTINDELKSLVENINPPQTWMVITENWCGDSAQNLPYINAIASENLNINLKIILRDSNLDIMDEHLTNGTRSIPILISYDDNENILFKWGPRPKAAQDLMDQLKEEGLSKPEKMEKLHLWYGRNRGKDIEAEFKEIMEWQIKLQEELI